mmetsp:Transcript_41115/g.89771  ORF Transcript_41115/g.89771 Transcript_41115/m.89771 type:complete len:91 (-) Transcript_41115:37-309(-)
MSEPTMSEPTSGIGPASASGGIADGDETHAAAGRWAVHEISGGGAGCPPQAVFALIRKLAYEVLHGALHEPQGEAWWGVRQACIRRKSTP